MMQLAKMVGEMAAHETVEQTPAMAAGVSTMCGS